MREAGGGGGEGLKVSNDPIKRLLIDHYLAGSEL